MTERQLYRRVKIAVYAAAVFVLVLVAVISIQIFSKSAASYRTAALEGQLKNLNEQSQSLDAELERKSSPRALADYAREKMGYVYKGYIRYRVVFETYMD